MTPEFYALITAFVLAAAALVTLVVNLRQQNRREVRDRAWLLEDRREATAELAAKIAAQAAVVASTVVASSTALAETVAAENARLAAVARDSLETIAARQRDESTQLREQLAREAQTAAKARAAAAQQSDGIAARLEVNTDKTLDVAAMLEANTAHTLVAAERAAAALEAVTAIREGFATLQTQQDHAAALVEILGRDRATALRTEGDTHHAEAQRIAATLDIARAPDAPKE